LVNFIGLKCNNCNSALHRDCFKLFSHPCRLRSEVEQNHVFFQRTTSNLHSCFGMFDSSLNFVLFLVCSQFIEANDAMCYACLYCDQRCHISCDQGKSEMCPRKIQNEVDYLIAYLWYMKGLVQFHSQAYQESIDCYNLALKKFTGMSNYSPILHHFLFIQVIEMKVSFRLSIWTMSLKLFQVCFWTIGMIIWI
jgi:hypothetical protein